MIADGAPSEVIEAAQSSRQQSGDTYEVWQENWQSVIFFLTICTQWNVVAGMGGLFYVGLNHTAIESNMNMRGIKKQARVALCDDLLIMERAALEVLNTKD